MKRSDFIMLLLCLLAVGVSLVVVRCPRTVPYRQCSEVYKRYSHVEGVRATYVKDFPVNDTLKVGVTLLEATDPAGWDTLVKAFNILPEMIEDTLIEVWTRKSCRNHPEIVYNPKDSNCQDGFEVVAMSMKKQMICILHTRSEQEWDAIFDKQIEANL